MQILARLWSDDRGTLVVSEGLFLRTILILGCIAGLVAFRNAITSELKEAADAVKSVVPHARTGGDANPGGMLHGVNPHD
jgi:hypothetical protein